MGARTSRTASRVCGWCGPTTCKRRPRIPQASSDQPTATSRPTRGELADQLSELPEARLVRRPGRVAEVLLSPEPIRRAPIASSMAGADGVAYPEWDWHARSYRPHAAVVRERTAAAGEMAWAETTLRRYSALIRAVRRDFERLRPRRMAFRRQPEGSELDIDALVAGWADRRAGGIADERYYVDARPGRRDAAITLLIDASASTDGWVIADRRIIDVEKETLLVASEALAALGDPHAMLDSGQRRAIPRHGSDTQALRGAPGEPSRPPAHRRPRAGRLYPRRPGYPARYRRPDASARATPAAPADFRRPTERHRLLRRPLTASRTPGLPSPKLGSRQYTSTASQWTGRPPGTRHGSSAGTSQSCREWSASRGY